MAKPVSAQLQAERPEHRRMGDATQGEYDGPFRELCELLFEVSVTGLHFECRWLVLGRQAFYGVSDSAA